MRESIIPGSKSSKATGAEVPTLGKLHSGTQLIPGFRPIKGGSIQLVDPEEPMVAIPQRPNTEETGTRFMEINRDSAQFGRRFKIGQRIRVDEQGMYVPDESPGTDESHRISGDGLLSATTLSSLEGSSEEFHTPPRTATRPLSPGTDTPTVPPPNAGLIAERQRHEGHDAEIARYRTQSKGSSAEIEVLQQDTFTKVASAQSVLGWIIVGRGVEWLPYAEVIEGATKEDILWQHANKLGGEKRFYLKVIGVGLLLFLICKSAGGHVKSVN